MNFEEYREYYLNSINNLALCENIHSIDAFINDVGDMLINDFNVLNEINLCNFERRKGNKAFKSMKIDAYSTDVITNTVNLIIADFNDGQIKNITNENKNDLSQLLLNFFENVLKGFFKETEPSALFTQASYDILDNINSINKIHLFILSTNKISNRVKKLTLEPYIFQGKVYNVKLDIIDFERIYRTKAEGFDKEDIVIETSKFGVRGIPCIKAQIETNDYDSYLAVIPGEFLADIYDEYSSELLESNVRSFLSFRGAVNKGIRGTILNDRNKFFTYNNGISATAKSVECEFFEGEGLLITKFVGLQIINGGQTTASLASTRIKDKATLKNIYVQMKLTIVKQNDPDFVRNIAKFANTQNKVTSADLNSNHPYYTRIEEFSRKIYAPATGNNAYQELWFFERARGQYEQPMMKMITKKQRDDYQRINPKNKKFTKTDLAKFENSANMLPYFVSWGADVNATRFQEQLEKNWEKDNTIYNEYYYKELIGKAILFKTLEKVISQQEWYIEKKAYRPQLVTYTFSKFVYEVTKIDRIIDYKHIWDKQEVPELMISDLTQIAKLAFDNIYGQKETPNISTYCKRKICRERLMSVPYTLSEETQKCLITKSNRDINITRAKKEQRNNNNVISALEIFKLGPNKIQSLLVKSKEQNVINYKEIELLEIAVKYTKNGMLVSDKQARVIDQIIKKLNEYGIE